MEEAMIAIALWCGSPDKDIATKYEARIMAKDMERNELRLI